MTAGDTPVTITYSGLAELAEIGHPDGLTVSFRVEAVSSGTLTKNGTPVTPGSTLLSTGESLVWTPGANANGTLLNAFTVVAFDGALASSPPVQVQVVVAAVNDAPTVAGLDPAIQVESFSTMGTANWTVPAGVTSVEVLVVGGGGAGGGDVGGGGGGGQVISNSTVSVTPGSAADAVNGVAPPEAGAEEVALLPQAVSKRVKMVKIKKSLRIRDSSRPH